MDVDTYLQHLRAGLSSVADWERRWEPFETAPELAHPAEPIQAVLRELGTRLTDNYPFFHPRYAGQMLKPPHPVATLAYAMAMRINPNNHALDGGPATAQLEREAVGELARMFGYGTEHLGHLTSSGTIANLEALWVARQLHPGKAVAFSEQAHYTHGRMCEVLGVRAIVIQADAHGRLDLADLARRIEDGELGAGPAIGTVVATLGTTGIGAVDPIDKLTEMAASGPGDRPRRFRLHVDAAYGGFYRLLADRQPPEVDRAPFRAVAAADSIVVDPHKHGLQPYGCGCALFKDPAVGALYKHDSPYTYFSSKDPHLGEISLECSRAGAAAAAFWATLRCFPLQPDRGLGPVLAATRRAALDFAKAVRASDVLELVFEPELDILAYFPFDDRRKASEISSLTEAVFERLMADPAEPVYLAKLVLPRHLAEPHAKEMV
ncbi:MAG: aspartate aminotransferase family protein, partial [Candidatus Sericytochromatia bacterium]|nr:aspartate aminotransferase family protein [Candidatus Tanganyikabacteria bacterium]